MLKLQKYILSFNLECKLCARLSNLSTFTVPCEEENCLDLTLPSPKAYKSHKYKLETYLNSKDEIQAIKSLVPEKYLVQKINPAHLYMIDPTIAKILVSHIIPHIQYLSSDHIIADCNPGLGLIGKELLRKGIDKVRFYEPNFEFRDELEKLDKLYPGRVEIIDLDLFRLPSYSFFDRVDNGSRLDDIFADIPRKSWSDEPVMTIIGATINNYFLGYLARAVATQISLAAYGRVQLFLMMKPKDYLRLVASHLNLNFINYKYMAVMFDLLYDIKIIAKLPREAFLPWERKVNYRIKRQINQIDENKMYFVHLTLKKDLPLNSEELVPFYFFLRQFFVKRTKIIPAVETWIPGCGENIIWPKLLHEDYFEDMSIHTQFGDLNPTQIVELFREIYAHPSYAGSQFVGLVEAELTKGDLIEAKSNMISKELEEDILEDIESNLDNT